MIIIILALIVISIFLAYQLSLYRSLNQDFYKINNSLHKDLSKAKKELQLLQSQRHDLKKNFTVRTNTDIESDYQSLVQQTDIMKAKSQQLKHRIKELEKEIHRFKEQQASINNLKDTIQELKDNLRLHKGQIVNLQEKDKVLEKKRQAVTELKVRIRNIKDKQQTRIDSVKASMGNQGYLVKDGEPTLPADTVIKLKEITVEK